MASRLESLHLIETSCWQELERAVREREHGWHALTLATVGEDRAEARLVVVREVLAAERSLRFYTDARSPKVRQLRAHPGGTLVGWHPRLAWQLRLRVQLTLEADAELVRSRWAQVMHWPSAQDYLAERAPGDHIERPGPEVGNRDHFAVITARVESMDWLELHAEGHRRAVFNGTQDARWVVP